MDLENVYKFVIIWMSKQKIDWLGTLKKYVDTNSQRTAQ